MGCCKLNIHYRIPLKSYACSYIIILFNVKRIRLAKVTFWNILAAFIIWICYTIGTCIIIMNPMHRTSILCISGIEFSTYCLVTENQELLLMNINLQPCVSNPSGFWFIVLSIWYPCTSFVSWHHITICPDNLSEKIYNCYLHSLFIKWKKSNVPNTCNIDCWIDWN